MSGRAWLLALVIAIGGCASNKPAITIPATVEIPVAVPCITDAIERPAFKSDAELAALDDYRLVLELGVDRIRRRAYEALLEAAVAGCR